jgi:hypothetical protein
MVESLNWRRMRWRLRGAWLWPAFAALTLFDALLAARLPFQGEGADLIGALLFAGFVNLLAVAVFAPFAGMALRRRRRDLPAMIARDYAGTALLVGIAVLMVAGGIAHRSSVQAQRADERAVVVAVHDYVLASAPAFTPGLPVMDLRRLYDDHYRACVYRSQERLPICLFVNTDQSPAGVKRDPARHPNEGF